jgi:hypothetical protein
MVMLLKGKVLKIGTRDEFDRLRRAANHNWPTMTRRSDSQFLLDRKRTR